MATKQIVGFGVNKGWIMIDSNGTWILSDTVKESLGTITYADMKI